MLYSNWKLHLVGDKWRTVHITHWALLLDYLWAKLLTLVGYDSESTVTKETRKQAFLSSGCTSEDR